jgi:thiamine-phosphate pyrophosphorylase
MSESAAHIATRNAAIRGLYAVTPDESDTSVLAAKVSAALNGGVKLVQYRNKAADECTRREQALALLTVCRARGVPLIINDDANLAFDIDADGVHLGADDGSIEGARARLAADKIIDVSCYNRLQTAAAAQRAGATYVAFGSFFPSSIKPAAVAAPLQLLREARAALTVPVVAIGGIIAANTAMLITAGADSVAVISAFFAASDVEAAARQIAAHFPSQQR